MKRSSLSRKTPLKAGPGPERKPMKRRAKRKPVNDKRWRSPAYLAWVRQRPCSACGTTESVAAHHVKGIWHLSGSGLKAPDSLVMPLCDGPGDTCHRKAHNESWMRHLQPTFLRWTLRAALAEDFDTDTREALTHALAFVEAQEERA